MLLDELDDRYSPTKIIIDATRYNNAKLVADLTFSVNLLINYEYNVSSTISTTKIIQKIILFRS